MSIPGAANPLLLTTAAVGGYQISRSVRFNSIDSAYLSRTPASAGNRKTWTWAGWVKRSGSWSRLFAAGSSLFSNPVFTAIGFDTDKIVINEYNYPSAGWGRDSVAVFRDYSAWYHIVVAVDTTQATDTNRVKLYVNGVEQSTVTRGGYSAFPVQNADTYINTTTQHQLSASNGTNSSNFYLADIHFIDGQALTPSSFTEVSATTGQLIPKAYTGSFGTNGFWLKFSDNSAATATTLGKDYSGNSNNWTPNNLSVTAGAGNDSLVDTPTSYGTGNSGGDVRGNFCTWNPLNIAGGALANGNLDLTNTAGGRKVGTIAVSSGKWYWEVTVTSAVDAMVGIMPPSNPATTASNNYLAGVASEYGYYSTNGQKYNNGSSTAYGATFTNGDVIGVALDMDGGTLVFYKNGTSQGTAFSGLSGTFAPGASAGGSSGASMTLNAGQRPFAYTAPSGFKALCDTNLPTPVVAKPNTVMDVKLYTGNGSTQTISGLGFSPDLVWIKNRSSTGYHSLTDVIRGTGKTLFTNVTDAEVTNDTGGYVTALTSDGFSVTVGSANGLSVNNNGQAFAAWTWDAGSSTVTNTQGSITSSVRANASAGFSVVTYTGNTGTNTIGHGLGVAPALILNKRRDSSENWYVYHSALGSGNYLILNATNASAALSWGGAPTSTVFYNSTSSFMTNGGTYVAYCFAPVAGYSSFGSYVGNGSADGPFVFCGFRPRWILLKSSSTTGSWCIYDTARNTYNLTNLGLYPNYSSAEGTETSNAIDVLSNGFKLRGVGGSDPALNGNGQTIVYAAFAESPFQYARAR